MPCSAIDYISGTLMAYGAMLALARRAREGGSWLVRVALARTGKWILDRGTVGADLATAQEPAGLVMETQSPAGLITHLKPVVQLSETPARWARPPVPLGHHRPEWP
jgi:crotonobetainyl-CoA:carnitine CoA-transferase CaiB-like acyl-CoA transferase